MKRIIFAIFAALLSTAAIADGLVGGSASPGMVLIGVLKGANFNTTADQPIPLFNLPASGLWNIQSFRVTNPSASLSTAVGGIYTGTGKSGLAVLPASQAYNTLTSNVPNTTGSVLIGGANAYTHNVTTLYFSLTTAQGAPATADIYIYGFLFP